MRAHCRAAHSGTAQARSTRALPARTLAASPPLAIAPAVPGPVVGLVPEPVAARGTIVVLVTPGIHEVAGSPARLVPAIAILLVVALPPAKHLRSALGEAAIGRS